MPILVYPLLCSSQSELRLPLLQVVSNNKSFSVGVQSPTEINAPRGCAVILRRICQLSLTRITHQVSRAFDLNASLCKHTRCHFFTQWFCFCKWFPFSAHKTVPHPYVHILIILFFYQCLLHNRSDFHPFPPLCDMAR